MIFFFCRMFFVNEDEVFLLKFWKNEGCPRQGISFMKD